MDGGAIGAIDDEGRRERGRGFASEVFLTMSCDSLFLDICEKIWSTPPTKTVKPCHNKILHTEATLQLRV
jgi:hypothetical protein